MATRAPVVTTKNAVIDEGQAIAASALIGSVTDSLGKTISEYAIMDTGAGGSHLVLNGVALTAGKWYYLTAAQFASLTYVGGTTAATDTVSIQAFDGTRWSATATASITIEPPPTITAANQTIATGQTIAGSSLLGTYSDGAGYAVTQYAIYDSGTDGAHLVLNGVTLNAGQWYYLTPAQIAALSYVGGASAGTDTISIRAFDGHLWSSVATETITQKSTSILGQLTDQGIEADVA
jgi:hypothetical protein